MRPWLAVVILVLVPAVARAQFKAPPDDGGPCLGAASSHRVRVGVVIKATSPVYNALATIPVPDEWPEQQLSVVEEDVTSAYAKVSYRDLDGRGVRLMIVSVPRLAAGVEARALVTFEVAARTQSPPSDTTIYRIPKKVDRGMTVYLGTSPYIESRHPKIVSTARLAVGDREGAWEKVQAIYEWERENVKYADGELKGAVRTLYDGEGGADELSSLFIALCRSQKIPARTVFIYGDCYAEFYLEDDQHRGHWFPCQLTGLAPFATIDQPRAIFQKGDNFRDPQDRKERRRFVKETFTASGRGKAPSVKFVRELVDDDPDGRPLAPPNRSPAAP